MRGESQFRFHDAETEATALLARRLGAQMLADDDDDDDHDDEDRGRTGRRSEGELAEQVRRLITRRGGGESGAQAVALKLLDDNEKAREGRRKWKDRAIEAEKKVPKEGEQVVVAKADAELLTAYKTHGTPDEVKLKIEKGVTLEAADKNRTVSETVASAATLAKLNGKLLAKLADPSRENFVVELRDEQHDGKTVKVPYARKNEANAPFKPLAEYAKTELADYHAALIVMDGSAATGGGGTSTTHTAPVVDQSPSGTAQTSGLAQKFLDDRNKSAAAKPNPLVPAPAAVAKT